MKGDWYQTMRNGHANVLEWYLAFCRAAPSVTPTLTYSQGAWCLRWKCGPSALSLALSPIEAEAMLPGVPAAVGTADGEHAERAARAQAQQAASHTATALAERLRGLAETLAGDQWEHPITAEADCLEAAAVLDRLGAGK